jgi:YVTN family beta-propeller protein
MNTALKRVVAGGVLALLAQVAGATVVVVLNSGDATVSLIDQATRKEIKRFDIGKEPHHLMASPDGQSLIVANAAGNDLVFLNPATGEIQRRVKNIPDPYQIGYSPDKKWFVAAGNRLHRVDIYAASNNGQDLKLAKAVPAPKTPSHIAFSADSAIAFVTLQDSDELIAIRLADQTPLWKMKTGNTPAGIWMTPDDKHLLIGMTGADFIEVIDWRAQKSVKRIKTGRGAHNFRPLGDGRHVYVSNRVDNTVSLIDQATLEKKHDIAVPYGPDCMEITADGKRMWVTQRFGKTVSIVDLESRKIVETIPVGKSPHGVFFNNAAGWK